MTRIKLVLAQPKGFVLSELWQVTVAMTRRIINHLPVVSGDMTQAIRTPAHRLWEHGMQNFGHLVHLSQWISEFYFKRFPVHFQLAFHARMQYVVICNLMCNAINVISYIFLMF